MMTKLVLRQQVSIELRNDGGAFFVHLRTECHFVGLEEGWLFQKNEYIQEVVVIECDQQGEYY
jgi:hypothetical protein